MANDPGMVLGGLEGVAILGLGIPVKDPWVFFGASGVLIAYLLYMMVRRRKGERPGTLDREPEL